MTFDPAVFDPDAVTPETQAFLQMMKAMREQMPSMENTEITELRRLMEEGGGAIPLAPTRRACRRPRGARHG